MVYIHSIREKHIIVVSSKNSLIKKTINGKVYHTRKQDADRTFGVLCMLDDNGQAIDHRAQGFKTGQKLDDVVITDADVMKLGADGKPTDEATGLKWAE